MPAIRIMIIRHAEKPGGKTKGVNHAGAEDKEELIVRGWQRSGALVRLFDPRGGKFFDRRLERPATIFASRAGVHSKSLRPQHTVHALANKLGLKLDLRFPKGEEDDLAAAAMAAKGPVLIAWEHEAIPKIANAIVGDVTTCPQRWKGTRFDLVWVFHRKKDGHRWRFAQVPQMLLPGDSKAPIVELA